MSGHSLARVVRRVIFFYFFLIQYSHAGCTYGEVEGGYR